MDKRNVLKQKGKYILGDSAYAIRSFLITPYENAKHGSENDTFNYHHSSCRISIECCFGELHQRWGILWGPLKFSLNKNIIIIDSVMRLHNYIIDYDIKNGTSNRKLDVQYFDNEAIQYMNSKPDEIFGVLGNDENSVFRGKHTRFMKQLTTEGKQLRDHQCSMMHVIGLKRPKANYFRNKMNRVVNDSDDSDDETISDISENV